MSTSSDQNSKNIRAAINERINRPSAIDEIKKGNDRKMAQKMEWSSEIREHWYIYILLTISAVFTGTLGLFMGLSPHLVTMADGSQVIEFNTDLTHILLAIVYVIAFIGTTELQFAISSHLFNDREEGNPSQQISMLVAMALAIVGIIGTGIAGGFVIASNIAFLSDFREIPHLAQKWVIIVIPIALAVFSILYLIYSRTSEAARAERILRDEERRLRADHRLSLMHTQLAAEGELLDEEINRIWALVQDHKITAADARAYIAAGKVLGDIEIDRNQDLDGNGVVGNGAAAVRVSNSSRRVVPAEIVSSWYCPDCGAFNAGNFCEQCGTKKTEKVPASRSNGQNPH